VSDILEKGASLSLVMPKLVAKNPKGTRSVTEPAGDFTRLAAADKEGPKRFVLPMERFFGGKEEAGFIGLRYSITMSDRHVNIMLQIIPPCQHIVCLLRPHHIIWLAL
jgi:hypothetical protein